MMGSAQNMPQPNTFARSKDDVLQALSFYFGQPVSPEKLKDYNEHHAATCTRLSQSTANDLRTPAQRLTVCFILVLLQITFPVHLQQLEHESLQNRLQRRYVASSFVGILAPLLLFTHSSANLQYFQASSSPCALPPCPLCADAYIGQNTQLRDTINNLVEKSPQTWHTTIGLPFRRIEGTVVEWDEISFDVRLMQRVPVRSCELSFTLHRFLSAQEHTYTIHTISFADHFTNRIHVFAVRGRVSHDHIDEAQAARPHRPPWLGDDDRVGFLHDGCRSQSLCKPAPVDPLLCSGDMCAIVNEPYPVPYTQPRKHPGQLPMCPFCYLQATMMSSSPTSRHTTTISNTTKCTTSALSATFAWPCSTR